MQRFFLSAGNINGDFIDITGGDASHISRSLRMKVGESIIVCDMQSFEYECVISSVTSDTVTVKIVSKRKNSTEPDYKAYLYQALPKGDKMDYIVQKAVELGVYSIIPFMCERCISKPDTGSAEKKRLRWQRIAEEAAKQCGRGIIPEVKAAVSYSETLTEAAKGDLSFMCYEGDGTAPLNRVISGNGRDIRFIIGPEGGFSKEETFLAEKSGLALAGLGKRILRCETASGFVLSCLAYEKELKFME